MSDQRTAEQEIDCTEGCTDECKHDWEFSPSPDPDFDSICADNEDAWETLLEVVEKVYDNMVPGEVRTITLKFNGVSS